jgi:hypothetical protein
MALREKEKIKSAKCKLKNEKVKGKMLEVLG